VALSSDQRLARGSIAVEALALTPQDFFVLSRVEGTPTMKEVVASTGLASADAEQTIARLVELGALELREPAPVTTRPSSPALRDKARDRRRELLRAQLRATAAPEGARPQEVRSTPSEPSVGSTDTQAEDELEDVPLASADDARLDPSLAIPVQDQRLVVGLYDCAEEITPFALLGIAPTHDAKVIRRAYHSLSRRMHPDAFYGRNLGAYRELLAQLFRRVKDAHDQLQDPSVREPLVDAHLETKARQQQAREQQRRALEAAEQQRQSEAQTEARARRQTRAADRLRAERKRFEAIKRAEAERFRADAHSAETAGELAKAANLYRLALQCSPDDAELHGRWQACLSAARVKRASAAFSRALSLVEVGKTVEASKHFIEAADAHPTAEHLAHAAEGVGSIDPTRARNYAMAALEAIGSMPAQQVGKGALQRGLLHLKIARAFLAAGQRESAREQALVAQRLRPDDAQIRALLNSTKVT
jgi:curved DNA-binding protein CbpA